MVTLVSTLHDPSGRMIEAARRLFPQIAGLYERVAVVPTSTTSPLLLETLSDALIEPLTASNGSIGVGWYISAVSHF